MVRVIYYSHQTIQQKTGTVQSTVSIEIRCAYGCRKTQQEQEHLFPMNTVG